MEPMRSMYTRKSLFRIEQYENTGISEGYE